MNTCADVGHKDERRNTRSLIVDRYDESRKPHDLTVPVHTNAGRHRLLRGQAAFIMRHDARQIARQRTGVCGQEVPPPEVDDSLGDSATRKPRCRKT